MTFVTASLAIAGLVAVAIPIIIHLLARQRRRPIEWAAMRFLLEAFRKHRRRLQLEQLILLAARCLIVALLGLALARPILEGAGLVKAGAARAVYLVIDDGMASGAGDEDGRTALQRHVKQAVALVNTLGAGDSVGLITAARPARALLAPPSTDRGAVVNLLESLAPKQSPTDLTGAFMFIRAAVDESKQSRQQTLVYLFSEFRNGSAALDSPLPATHAGPNDDVKLLAWAPASRPLANVQITAIEPVRSVVMPGASDGSGQITVRLSRCGGAAAAGGDVTRVRLAGEGLPPLEPRTVQWQPGQTQADVKFLLNFAAAADRAVALTALIDNDALVADNQRFAVLELRHQIRVLLIDRRSFGFERSLDQLSAGQWIRRALEPREKSPLQIVEVEPAALDVADARTADVAVLPRPDLLSDAGWKVLRQFVQRDGLLIIMPPAEVNVHQWTERLATDLDLPWRLGLEVAVHKDGLALAQEQPASELLRLISSDMVELVRPVLANRVLPVDKETMSTGQAQPLLVFADGSPLLIAGGPDESADRTSTEGARAAIQNSKSNILSPARGLVVYLAVAPELSWTNLPSKPLMVPLFQEIIRQGLSVIHAAQKVQVGEQAPLAAGPAARDLLGPAPQAQKITLDPAGKPQQPFEQAGVYSIVDQTEQPIGKLAVNVDPAAGVTDVQSPAAVSAWLNNSGPWTTVDADDVGATLSTSSASSPIAGLLLMLALALIILETVLARRFSHAYTEASSGEWRGHQGIKPSGQSLDASPSTRHSALNTQHSASLT